MTSAEPALGDPRAEPALGDPGAEPALGDPGAEPALGAAPGPGIMAPGPLGWYSRGYLPHRDHPGLLQVITYHLADSLPADAAARMDEELRRLPVGRRGPERRRRLETWLDAGHGCCVLREAAAAACVVENWRHFAAVRYDLIAWVVMPNHVHLLVRTYEGVNLGKIVQSWKSYTGRRIGALLRLRGERPGGGAVPGAVWMREYWDRYIRDEQHFHAAVRYIHENPVKAGLVETASDWAWSSARGGAVLGGWG